MLPRTYRLHTKRDLLRARASRTVFRSPHLTLRVVQRTNGGPPRIAIAVSRRVSRQAVERNHVARRLREAVWREVPRLRPAVDLLFTPSAPAREYSWERTHQDVRALLQRAGLLQKE